MAMGTRLLVGLGNPGAQYAATRHNIGAMFVEKLATTCASSLRREQKFHGFFTEIRMAEIENVKLLIPTTYMNESGRAVQAVAKFYKIPLENILIIHDELDFTPGEVRLKFSGGHNGHNGLRNIIEVMQGNGFYRLRVGIGRPRHKDVVNYVLAQLSNSEKEKIFAVFDKVIDVISLMVGGDYAKAVQLLHSN